MAEAQSSQPSHQPSSSPATNPAAIPFAITVQDAQTKALLAARVRILDSAGKAYGEQIHGYGLVTGDKPAVVELPPGQYTAQVSKRNDYEGCLAKIEVGPGLPATSTIYLKRRLNLAEMGWFCGEGHTHQGRFEGDAGDNVQPLLHAYGLAEGLNYVYMGQPHDGFKGETAQQFDEFIAAACGPNLYYRLGAEMPKTRYGHTWWMGLQKLDPPVEEAMDAIHEEWYQTKTGWTPDEKQFPYSILPPYELWHKMNVQGALGAYAHPTSWWMEDRKDGTGKLFVTNIASWLAFDLLCERQIDTMVVLGYRDEHLFYQALWFELLNRGYHVPGVGESDGSLGMKFGNNFIGQRRTYAYAGPGGSEQDWLDAVRQGRSFMSSGPILFATVNGQMAAGQELKADGSKVSLDIAAYADSVPTEFISHIVVYRNGKIFAHQDYTAQRPRQVQLSVELSEREPAWYVVKCYGSNPPAKAEYFDVLPYVKKLLEQGTDSPGDVGPIAITNPLYFAPEGYQPPAKIVPKYTVHVKDASGKSVPKGEFHVNNFGRRIAAGEFENGSFVGQWPATAEIDVETAAGAGTLRLFFDYPPLHKAMAYLREGEFTKKYPKILPGQVPFEAFHIDELAKSLREVEMTCVVK